MRERAGGRWRLLPVSFDKKRAIVRFMGKEVFRANAVAAGWLVPRPGDADTVHHVDGNLQNDAARNLKWGTHGDAVKAGTWRACGS